MPINTVVLILSFAASGGWCDPIKSCNPFLVGPLFPSQSFTYIFVPGLFDTKVLTAPEMGSSGLKSAIGQQEPLMQSV